MYGTVAVLYKGELVKRIFGDSERTIGEYLLVGEDSPGGNIVIGYSDSPRNDKFDYISLFRILPQVDGKLGWFSY